MAAPTATATRTPATLATRGAGMLGVAALAREAGIHPDLALRLIGLGLIEPAGGTRAAPLFRRQDALLLGRAMRLRRDLGVNYAGAVLACELLARIDELEPCLVFIDELDTIGKARGGAGPAALGGHDERKQTLTQLLSEMDGFDSSGGVIIMAATNRPEVLDPALLRPGRFGAILAVHARGVTLAPEVDLEVVAARTPGFAGAELANVINEAALLAARRGKPAVRMAELEEAIDRVSMGLERRSRVISPEERRRVAYHELRHALVAMGCPHADPVHRVSIVPRGVAALGVTQQLPADDRYLISQPELEDRLAVMMGGRAAELVVFEEISSGAANDLQQATALARRMVEQFGMSPKVGPVAISTTANFLEQDGRLEARSLRLIAEAEEMKELLRRADERAVSYLGERRAVLDRLADILLEREALEGPELKKLLEDAEAVPELARS